MKESGPGETKRARKKDIRNWVLGIPKSRVELEEEGEKKCKF